MRRYLKKILGLFCIVVGLAALALPIVPGIPLLLLGIYLFGRGDASTKGGEEQGGN